MSLEFLDVLDFDIDLAFTACSNVEMYEDIIFQEILFLNNREFWHQEIMIWIQYIRTNCDLNCPKIVRNKTSFSIGLQLTDDISIKKLNTQWRHKPEKTDVLAFPALDETLVLPENCCIELGDIIASIQTAQNQAQVQNHSLETELRWLVSHGLLHLLGWDHPDENDLEEMLGLQEQLLIISGNLHKMRVIEEEKL